MELKPSNQAVVSTEWNAWIPDEAAKSPIRRSKEAWKAARSIVYFGSATSVAEAMRMILRQDRGGAIEMRGQTGLDGLAMIELTLLSFSR